MRIRTLTLRLAGGVALGATLLLSLQTSPRPVHGGSNLTDVPPVNTVGGPRQALTPLELGKFIRGRALFDKDFRPEDGLGFPEMNADSCRACHQDPALGGAGPIELNVARFAHDNGGAGPYMDLPGGQAASKLRPPTTVGREEIDNTADVFEQRQTPTIFGAGLIDEIFEAAILANADPTDADADGISGVARMIDTGGASPEVGRFGWKNQIPRLKDFVKDAMGGECGITTPDDGRGFAFVSDGDGVPDPELSQTEVDEIAFFLGQLAAPQRAGGAVAAGEVLFHTVGCADCHVPTLNGPDGPVALWSDLLLHDVMPAGFRGMSEAGAGVGEYRTPPLWGIRDTAPYMHDGRASSLHLAIEAHFGEAAAAKANYQALSAGDRDELIKFLEDL